MKMRWKLFVILFMTFLLVGLVACGNNNATPTDDEIDEEEGAELNLVDGKIEPAVTITTIMAEDANMQFKEGESLTDNVHLRWAAEELGVNFEFLWTSAAEDAYNEKLNLSLAAKEELPDVFFIRDKEAINMFAESGLVLDAGEAFEKYASDTWKAAVEEGSPQAWWPFVRDDKRYAIPALNETEGSQPIMWIRQDWLDKLGLEAPTNIEELEVVMEAFTHQDPNDSGQDDIIPLYLTSAPDFSVNPVGDSTWIFGLFGAIPERWYPNADGELEYGSVQPEIKDALSKMQEWKEKGYISDEFALSSYTSIGEDVAAGKVGIFGGPQWGMAYPGSLLLQSNPEAVYQPYPLPVGVDGTNMRKAENKHGGGFFFNKDISEEALQAFFHYGNKLYSVYDSSDPFYFGDFQEGYDYVMQDGEKSRDVPGGQIQTTKYMILRQPSYVSKQAEVKLKIANGEELTDEDQAVLSANGKIDNIESFTDQLEYQGFKAIMEQTDADVEEYFLGPTTQTMGQRWEMLTRMQMETYIDIIYGNKPVDAFDDFVDEWHSSGGDDVTKEVNEWYDSVTE